MNFLYWIRFGGPLGLDKGKVASSRVAFSVGRYKITSANRVVYGASCTPAALKAAELHA